MKRLASIDVLRALALLLMIQVHFVENLAGSDNANATLRATSYGLGTIPAPIFCFLVGLSLWLWLQRSASLGKDSSAVAKATVRRGLFLFGGGLAFAVLIWLPKEVFNWDILTLLGTATLVLYVLRKWSARRLVVLALFILLISPHLRTVTDYAKGHYSDSFALNDVLLGFLLHGYFPLLPWLIFPLMGFATGKYFFADEASQRLMGWQMPGLGIALLGSAGVLSRFVETSHFTFLFLKWQFYPAITTFVLGALGMTFLGLWVLYRVLDAGPARTNGKSLTFFRRYSRLSLTTYVIHHAIHLWPLYLLAALRGKQDLSHYYGRAVSVPMALMLAVTFIVAFYPILIAWENRRHSLEWLLRWLSEP